MARANRHFIPGYVWHITHRCHKKDFLLKFPRDRRNWIKWLFEAKKRFGLSVLNFMVTSNHIHLLVFDDKGKDAIPRSMQLVASRTGQDYNTRKKRKGAFWEDRYQATAIERNLHLQRCLVYIDLNMVRAGAVDHPRDWAFCGYKEIQKPPSRYRIVDLDRLLRFVGYSDLDDFQKAQNRWVESSLSGGENLKESHWTESIAVGSESFVTNVKERLGFKAKSRCIKGDRNSFQLKEKLSKYSRRTVTIGEAGAPNGHPDDDLLSWQVES